MARLLEADQTESPTAYCGVGGWWVMEVYGSAAAVKLESEYSPDVALGQWATIHTMAADGRDQVWIPKGTSVRFTTSACLLYTSPSPRDRQKSRMPSSA